jgi:shikimate dehydrogenase
MKLAVIGNPIEHSKSPLIFRFFFDAVNLEYSYERISLDSANELIALFDNGYSGLNITAPFKQSSILLLDELSVEAKQIGSVNTVVSKNRKLFGYNTDYIGVLHALEENGVNLESKKCLILGAGGAARAAIYGLKKRNSKIQVYNRTEDKARQLADEFDVHYICEDDLQNAVTEADILIDTLPAGIQVLMSEWLHKNLIILDASYPKSVYDGSQVKQLIGGEHWLLHQAIPAFELFTGIKLTKNDYDQKALLASLIKTK